MAEMKLQDLAFAEEHEVENASAMRKQELMFAILKKLAEKDVEHHRRRRVEVLQDGFGFLRSPEANYLPGPDDIYVSPGSQIRRFSCDRRYGRRPRSAAKEGERYFALLKVNAINFEEPEKAGTRSTSTI
jgi:transcription termination factor Rho